MKGINQFLNEIKTIADSYKRMAEATGENFNIFSLLQVETDEVRTHSRFIAELLNPNGTHNQGDVFLKKFLQSFPQIEDFDTENTRVFVEYYVGKVEKEKGGQIDILLKDTSGNVIMIENKIYAGEQANQLLRYKNAFPNGKLFFLTLKGDESNNNKKFEDYTSISYENDIVNWLEECKKEAVNIPTLRETISQYINLIKKLTHQTTNKDMETEIHKLILENYEESSIIVNNFIKAQISLSNEILNKVLSDVKPFIEKNNWIIDIADSIKNEKSGGGIYFKPNLYQGTEWKIGICGFNPFIGHPEFQKRIFIGIWGRENRNDYYERYLSFENKNFNIGWWNDYIFVSDYINLESKLTNPALIENLLKNKIDDFAKHIVKDFQIYFQKHKNDFERMIYDIQN